MTQIGRDQGQTRPNRSQIQDDARFEIVIAGAGFAGLALALALRQGLGGLGRHHGDRPGSGERA